MARLSLSGLLGKTASKAEVDTLFADFANFVNVAKLPIDVFTSEVLRYRHLREPAHFYLNAFQSPLQVVSIPDDGVYHDMGINGFWIDFEPGYSNDIAIEVTGWYFPYTMGDQVKIALMKRDKGTLIYAAQLPTERNCGENRQDNPANNSRYAGLQTHYYTGVAASWKPGSAGMPHPIKVTGLFGQTTAQGVISAAVGFDRYTLGMLRPAGQNGMHTFDVGILMATARDIT